MSEKQNKWLKINTWTDIIILSIAIPYLIRRIVVGNLDIDVIYSYLEPAEVGSEITNNFIFDWLAFGFILGVSLRIATQKYIDRNNDGGIDFSLNLILIWIGTPFLIISVLMAIMSGRWEIILGVFVVLFFLKIYFSAGLAFIDNPLHYLKKIIPSEGKASVKGLGMLIAFIILLWGLGIIHSQMEANDAMDNVNEVYNENKEILEDAGVEKLDTEKEDSPIGFIILAIGILIFLYYFTREAET